MSGLGFWGNWLASVAGMAITCSIRDYCFTPDLESYLRYGCGRYMITVAARERPLQL